MSFDPNNSLLLSASLATKGATHALMKYDQASYTFGSKTTESDFYLSYMKMMPDFVNGTLSVSIGEFADEYAPVIYSFQGILPVTEETQEIPSDFLISLTELLQQLTRKMGKLSGQSLFENSQLTCILLGRTREEEQYYVYDLMFYFPGAVESREKIEQQLYSKVEEYLGSKRFNYKVNFEGFESDLYTKPIPMYAATVDDELPYDYLSFITMGSTTRINMKDAPHRVFPISDSALFKRELITSDEVNDRNSIEMDERSEQVTWLPIILSVRGNYQASSLRPPEQIVKSDFIEFNSGLFKVKSDASFVMSEPDLAIKEIRRFVAGWHPFRIDHETEWKLIGEAMFNFYKGDIKGLMTWESIVDDIIVRRRQILRKFNLNDDGSLLNPPPGLTPESEKRLLNSIYDDEAFKLTDYLDITERDREFKTKKTAVPLYILDEGRGIYRKFYFSFKVDRITYITLADNYKEDCPADFGVWHSDWVKEAIMCGTSGLDTDIAVSLYRFLFLEWFCYTMNGKDPIYTRHEGNRNREDEGKFTLKKIIVTKFLDFYNKLLYDLRKEKGASGMKDGGEVNMLIAKAESVIAKIKSQSFKERLIREAAIFFNKQGVTTFFDDNRELTCVNNGVIVAGAKGIVFRKGRLEDYVTKRFGTFYIDNLSERDPCVVRLMTWSKETFLANEPMISWWWKYLASTFRGGNDDKIFPFFFGRKGNEGKSAWTNFLEMMMGCYCSNVEISYFTNTPKDSNTATPITAMIYNAHLVLTEEAEDKAPIRSGAFKKKTGKDRLNKRALFGKAEVVDFQAKFLGVGNVLPTFSKIGTAEEERFWVIPVTSQRSKEAENYTEEEQYSKKMFKRDNFFDQNLQYYLTAGIWILVRYYSRYVAEGLTPYPEKMVKATKAYWLDHDKFRRFTKFAVELLGEEENDARPVPVKKEDFVDMKTIYDLFKEWHDDQYPKDKILNIDEVRRELRDKWGKIVLDKFYGVRLIKNVKPTTSAIGGKKQRDHGAEGF